MPSTLFVVLISALAASSVSAKPSLSLKVSGAERVNGVENLHITAALYNTGNESLTLLNDPRGPLSKTPTNTFSITGVNGTNAAFTGIKVKYSPQRVVELGRAESFTVLAPGQSVEVVHDLSHAYNITGGAGSYTINARSLFHYVDPATNQTLPIYADVVSHRAIVTGRMAVARSTPRRKRGEFTGCSADQQTAITEATKAATGYVTEAVAYLKNHTEASERFTTWWGNYTEERHANVLQQYTNLSRHDLSQFTYDCTCDEQDTFAYVYPDEFGTVYLCGSFWKANVTGSDSKGGTIVHESTHFLDIAGTEDIAYGQKAAQALAKSEPDSAVNNADSHEYFVENNPALA